MLGLPRSKMLATSTNTWAHLTHALVLWLALSDTKHLLPVRRAAEIYGYVQINYNMNAIGVW